MLREVFVLHMEGFLDQVASAYEASVKETEDIRERLWLTGWLFALGC